MNPTNPTPIGLSVRDAATLTSLSEWEIREAIANEEIPVRRRGRRIMIDHDALVAWYESHPLVTKGASA